MSDNKLVKTLTDAATVTGLAAGIGFLAKKVIKEPMTSDSFLKSHELCKIHSGNRRFFGNKRLS